MFFKRLTVFGAFLGLYIIGYIVAFAWRDSVIDDQFRADRKQYGVDGQVLIAKHNAPAAPAPAAEAPADTQPNPPAPASQPTTAPADSNYIIGPLPPSGAPASTNAPSSTYFAPKTHLPGWWTLTSYHPQSLTNGGAATAPSEPATNTAPAPSLTTNIALEAPNPATIATPSTNASPASPVAVEASVIVLLYHQFYPPNKPSSNPWNMNVDEFEREMKYLHDNGYHVISMSDLLKFLHHEIGLPPNSVVITVDDGYKSSIVYGAPILKKYGFPWTFFVYPEFITENEGTGAASWKDLLELQADGVDIECHSMTHPKLTKHYQKFKGSNRALSPEEYDQWLTNETLGAKQLLEKRLGRPVTCFAYPYGDYNKEVEAKTIAAGYDAIFTVASNPVHSSTPLHSIGRYTITQSEEKNLTAYLRQGALGLSDISPAPGTITHDPRPVITATLGYAGTLKADDLETTMKEFGIVKHDFDPKTSTLRIYLPRDLVQPVNTVNIRVRDAQTGQVMVANWHFNYEAAGAGAVHAPIAGLTNGLAHPAIPATNEMGAPANPNDGTPLGATAPATPAPVPVVPSPH